MAKWDKPHQAFLFVSAIGVDLAVCTVGGAWIGKSLDQTFSTSPVFLLVGLLVGLATSIFSIYLLIKPFMGD